MQAMAEEEDAFFPISAAVYQINHDLSLVALSFAVYTTITFRMLHPPQPSSPRLIILLRFSVCVFSLLLRTYERSLLRVQSELEEKR
jgi:hypothetical protein